MSAVTSVPKTDAFVIFVPVPFAPVHLLFMNLLTDSLPAIAIGMEPPEDNLLSKKPRDPNESILNKTPELLKRNCRFQTNAKDKMQAAYLVFSLLADILKLYKACR